MKNLDTFTTITGVCKTCTLCYYSQEHGNLMSVSLTQAHNTPVIEEMHVHLNFMHL